MKKILHIEIQKNIGGIERFLCNITSNLGDEYIHDFITTKEYGDYINELNYRRIIKINSVNHIVNYMIDLYMIMKNNEYDYIHIHKNSLANIIPIIIAYILKKDIIIHSHNTKPKYNNLLVRLLHYCNRNLLKYMNVVRIACSNKAGEWLYGGKHFHIIRNGINYSEIIECVKNRDSIRKKYSIYNDTICLGSVAAFITQKNHEYIIDILASMIKKKENVKLILIGTGYRKNKIIEYIKKLGVEDNIVMLGERRDVYNLLSAIDVIIMPSFYEGLPVSALEAQIAGCSVFITDNVDRDVCLSDKIHFKSLLDGPDSWADNIIKNKEEYKNRSPYLKNKYKIENTVVAMHDIYEKGR